jgi:dephospho-CoA kinase
VLTLGVTGGIACGKSTVTRWLADSGARVLDADQVARAVVEPGTPGLADVARAFGAGVLRADGTLDRAQLGARVFADANARQQLNALLHPRIVAGLRRELDDAAADDAPLTVIDAALLFELGLDRWCDAVLTVEASPELQVARLMARNGLDAVAARQRVDAQWSRAQREERAHWTIDNRGTLAELRAAFESWWQGWRGKGPRE